MEAIEERQIIIERKIKNSSIKYGGRLSSEIKRMEIEIKAIIKIKGEIGKIKK